jgi:hypothetical protein
MFRSLLALLMLLLAPILVLAQVDPAAWNSLHQLEHEWIRALEEPRIHFMCCNTPFTLSSEATVLTTTREIAYGYWLHPPGPSRA